MSPTRGPGRSVYKDLKNMYEKNYPWTPLVIFPDEKETKEAEFRWSLKGSKFLLLFDLFPGLDPKNG